MNEQNKPIAYYHLPGLFEHFEFYREYLKLYKTRREYFYDWCEIGSIYGAPGNCIWGGGRIECGSAYLEEIVDFMNKYRISSRLTFSNSQLKEEHLEDAHCNQLLSYFVDRSDCRCGVTIYSDLLLDYLVKKYPDLYFVSSTTKVLTKVEELRKELNRKEFEYVVPDFRFNKKFEELDCFSQKEKDKVEFLCNECCSVGCKQRKECYEAVSKQTLGIESDHKCKSTFAKNGYQFSKAMENPAFISIEDIKNVYLPKGFSNFKIEGRGLGSALVLEMLIYYMVKPKYQIHVRESIYLDNMLDLF